MDLHTGHSYKRESAMKRLSIPWAILAAVVCVLWLSGNGYAVLPEPDVIYYGKVYNNYTGVVGISVNGGAAPLATFQLDSDPDTMDEFVLRVPMDSAGTRETGKARTGDPAQVAVNGSSVMTTTIPERGTVVQLDLDGEAPVSAITAPAGGADINGAVYPITGTASDIGSGVDVVELSTDGGVSWLPAADTSGDGSWSTWSYDWSLPADGSYTVACRATDLAANVELPGAGVTVTVDNTDPSSAITAPVDGASLNGIATIIGGTAGDGTGAGVALVEVSTDNGNTWSATAGTAAWEYSWPLPADGIYSIMSRATDNAGNAETPGAGMTVTVDRSLVAHYMMDGDATDATGNGHDGTLHGPVAAMDRFGATGASEHFTRISGGDATTPGDGDYVEIPTDPALHFTASSDSYTVAAWAKPAIETPEVPFANMGVIEDHALNGGYSYQIQFYHNSVNFGVRSGTSAPVAVLSPQTYPADRWYHVAMVVTGGQMLGYVNGELVGTADVSAATGTATGEDVQIGRGPKAVAFTRFFDGEIDDVRIYRRALTLPELQAVVAEGGYDPDFTAPASVISAPSNGAMVAAGLVSYNVTGTATDAGGSGLTLVEVSTDGGSTWNTATGTASWSYGWTLPAAGSYTIKSRATDASNNAESPGAGVAVTVTNMADTPQLPHLAWDAALGGGCTACHNAPSTFLAGGYREDPKFCGSCHNASGIAHEQNVFRAGHSMFGSVTTPGVRMPTYGNITAGDYDNRMFANLKDGDKVVCTTCHNPMQKTENIGRTWEYTTTPDNITYTMQNGGWSGSGYMVPAVYRDSSLWAGPSYVSDKKAYVVAPSEYTYNEDDGTITFGSAQDPGAYVYVTLGYPYLRVSSQNNGLCSDCHTQATHRGANCMECHGTHNTDNIAGMRETVRTAGRSERVVSFAGYSGAGSFADGGGTHDGICEVCHTTTAYYRRDGSAPASHSDGVDYTGKDCTLCHRHADGFTSYTTLPQPSLPDNPVTLSSLTPTPGSPVSAGNTVHWVGTGAGGTGSYQYQFWVWDGTWGGKQNWSASNAYDWTPGSAGTYQILCQTREAGQTAVADFINSGNFIVQ